MNVDSPKRGPFPTAPAGRTFGTIPPTALVLLGIVSVQLGSALAKHLFTAVGSFGTVALRLFFAAVVLTAVSRNATLLCLWIALVVFATHGRVRQLVGVGALGAVSIVALAFLAPTLVGFVEHRFDPSTVSQDPRTFIYQEGYLIAQNNPLVGIGPNQFQHELLQAGHFNSNTTRQPHNNFIFLASQYGLVPMIFYAFYVIAFGFYFFANFWYGAGRARTYALYGLLAISAFFISGMTEAALTTDYFYIALGIMMWGTNQQARAGHEASREPDFSSSAPGGQAG